MRPHPRQEPQPSNGYVPAANQMSLPLNSTGSIPNLDAFRGISQCKKVPPRSLPRCCPICLRPQACGNMQFSLLARPCYIYFLPSPRMMIHGLPLRVGPARVVRISQTGSSPGRRTLATGLVVHTTQRGPVSNFRIFHAYIKGTLLALVFVSLLHPVQPKVQN